ncbi:MAG: hypothetical protein R3B90_06490 [Planctomycetaceae bacterium]
MLTSIVPSRSIAIATTAIAIAFLAGCAETTSPTPPATAGHEHAHEHVEPQVPWAEQLAAVRAGTSDRIETSDDVTPEQFAELATGCDGLTTLRVAFPEVNAERLSVLPQLVGLQHLLISGPVDDDALTVIARCPTLEILNLPDGTFTDAGFEQLKSLPLLTLLRIGSPQVTDAGIAVLPELPNLRQLHIINIPITDDGLDSIRQVKLLQSFYLDGGECTDEGLGCLLKAREDLHMHVDQLHIGGDKHAHSH